MPQASDGSLWMSASLSSLSSFLLMTGLAVVLASAMGVVLTAVAQLSLERRAMQRRTSWSAAWSAGLLAALLAGLCAASMGADDGVIGMAVIAATLAAWFARGRNLTRRPQWVAVLGSGLGLAVMSAGIARYLAWVAQGNVERAELYALVFIGALIFATSLIAFCALRGALQLNATARPGHGIVNLLALLLCGWLGYGFVTGHAQPLGLAALLAMSALACAIGVHLMTSREYAHDHDGHALRAHAFPSRCQGLALDSHGVLARIEWRGGDEQIWTLREIEADKLRTAAYTDRRTPQRRASLSGTSGRSGTSGTSKARHVSTRRRYDHSSRGGPR